MFGDYFDGYTDGVAESTTTGGGFAGLRERTTVLSPLTKAIVSRRAEEFFEFFYTKYDACSTSAEKATLTLITKIVVGFIAVIWGYITSIPLALAGLIVLSPIALLALVSEYIGSAMLLVLPVLVILGFVVIIPWGLTINFRFILLPWCFLSGWFDDVMPEGEYTNRYLNNRVAKEYNLNDDQGIEGKMNMIQKMIEKHFSR